jgi:hypothetical protein
MNKNLLMLKIINNKNNLAQNFKMKSSKILNNSDKHLCQESLYINLQWNLKEILEQEKK